MGLLVRLAIILSGLREKVEGGFTTEFAEGTEGTEGRGVGTPSPVLRKDVIPRELGVRIVQECDSKWVAGAGWRSNWGWALILGKSS